jgi:hypothetical protein
VPGSLGLLLHDLVVAAVAITLYHHATKRRSASMSGFLEASGYYGEEEIDLGNGYWVKVKKCLSSEEMGFVEDTLGAGRQKIDVSNGGRQFAELDLRASWREMVVQSLASWNIDGDPWPKGTIWPLDAGARFAGRGGENPYPAGCPRRQAVAALPDPVFKQVWQKCDQLNSPQRGSEAASFPDQDERRDPDGDTGAAGAAPVPPGEGPVAELRDDQGGGKAPAAP